MYTTITIQRQAFVRAQYGIVTTLLFLSLLLYLYEDMAGVNYVVLASRVFDIGAKKAVCHPGSLHSICCYPPASCFPYSLRLVRIPKVGATTGCFSALSSWRSPSMKWPAFMNGLVAYE